MRGNKSASIAVILTIILFLVIAVFSIFMQLVAFNGASESQALTGIVVSLLCQGTGAVVMALFALRLTNFLIAKANWGGTSAVILAVFLGALLGMGIAFLSLIFSALVSGIS
jgi:hypothetical protein